MAIPKNYRKNLMLGDQSVGFEQRQKLLDKISEGQGYLPRGITYEDMDRGVIDFVKTELEIEVEGQKVPVYIVSIQRWFEFYSNWENVDEYGNLTLPFIVITRKIDTQKGTTHGNNYNIPGFLTWSYVRVPSTDGIREGYDLYQIPQPIAVDIQYEVRFFGKSIRNLNILNSKIQTKFSARQTYIDVNGHPMPLILDTVSDESQTENLEQRKFYVQPYTIKLMGYLLNENDFKVIPSVNRTILMTELMIDNCTPVNFSENVLQGNKNITLTFTFNGGTLTYTTNIGNTAEYKTITSNNVNSYSYLVNGSPSTLPFIINSGDTLKVTVSSKTDNTLPCSVTFNGITS